MKYILVLIVHMNDGLEYVPMDAELTRETCMEMGEAYARDERDGVVSYTCEVASDD